MFRPTITPHPDAPILITNTIGPFLKAAVYDTSRNALVPAGWFYLSKYDGWTLHKFDWEKRINSKPPED
ncbi:MAG: hypothetical protein HN909_02675 [Phycisphaerales bacterium]|jgi:hypothetical protein|nr:hypothetical protein [Phycisphaerales bacterium]MBT7170656.1 hypothetical protein [Phycisphaerales bacterium]